MTTQQDPFQSWKDAVAERDGIIQRWTIRAQYLEERVGILEDFLAQMGVKEFPARNPELRRLLRELPRGTVRETPQQAAEAPSPPSAPPAPPEGGPEEKDDPSDQLSPEEPPPKGPILKSLLDLGSHFLRPKE